KLTERIGFWVDLPEAYVTYHRSYVESVWWALAELFRKGLLYRGHKVVWWWPQGGTALSAGEVGLGYREVDDPEVVVRFRSSSRQGVSYLAWTTTPWTLPSNIALAVSAGLEYLLVRVDHGDGQSEKVILAASQAAKLLDGLDHQVLESFSGQALVGERYEPLFRYAEPEGGPAFRIIAADFVSDDSGSGIVHVAPAFGEDDFRVCRENGLGFLQLVEPDGTFPEVVEDFAGRFCKQADRDIIRKLRAEGKVFTSGTYRHDYPFCWRASNDPLIQYARPAWFVRTTAEISRAIENNRQVTWLPEHIRDGRFGDFLANNVDWALSRERYWGTPLPIWECGGCGHLEAMASLDEVLARNHAALEHWNRARKNDPTLSEHLVVHKPWVDAISFECPGCGAEMRRVSEVVDCWFDSGCMPFAQFGFPHRGVEAFRRAFPADFISEAIDQTRGWFYSLLMCSTLLFDEATQRRYGLEPPRSFPHPYKTCIVLGHVCDPEGKKESKSSGNYTPPDLVLEGAFELRLADAPSSGEPPPDDALMLLPAQVKTLGMAEGAELTVCRADDTSRRVSGRLVPGMVGKESVVLGAGLRAALGLEAGQSVRIEVLDDPPGADAFRWFFYSAGPPWNNTRNSLRAIREQQNDFLVRWQNVLSFFLIYASIDGFDPARGLELGAGGKLPEWTEAESYRPVAERRRLDRWILSEAALTARKVTTALDAYRAYDAATALRRFVDALSNWYVRRSRARFWAPGFEQDKADAYWTLWEVMVDLSLMAAPFVPFFSEHVYRTLIHGAWPEAQPESVHLADWPELPSAWIDEQLSTAMALAREAVSLGLSARAGQKIRVRQPLAGARIFLADPAHAAGVEELAGVIADELNVKQVLFGGDADAYVHWRLQPNFRAIGPRYGKLVPKIKAALATADAAALRAELDEVGRIELEVDGQRVELGPEDVAITLAAREHYAAASSPRVVVVLETEISPALAREGIAREVINRIQSLRKELDLDYADRIVISLEGDTEVLAAAEAHRDLITGETLADALLLAPPPEGATVRPVEIDGREVRLGLERRR
ncbi:MAG TPA: isoleucine--tRNA ligase, partial [Acidobacteria bacterium]|nr:isoleucine--tRNA ligase [Acidobacteriota bacterium]